MIKMNEQEKIIQNFIYVCRSNTNLYFENDELYFKRLFSNIISLKNVDFSIFNKFDDSKNLILDIDFYKFVNILLYNCYKLRYIDKYCSILAKMNFNGDIYEFLKDNDHILYDLSNYFINDLIFDTKNYKPRGSDNDFARYLINQYRNKTGISNYKLNISAINRCCQDVRSGKQLNYKTVNYNVGSNMFVSMDIGKHRNNQEDSSLIIEHPLNNKFKFMMVADGMGGADCGEFASNYITNLLVSWFQGLKKDVFYDKDLMESSFSDILSVCNSNLCYENKRRNLFSGSTFVGALIGKSDTVVANVGDSRAYSYINGNLKRITKDDSYVQSLYDNGTIKYLDDMRFHVASNQIVKYMGYDGRLVPNIFDISNRNYDYLMLFSDGVVDCLSDEQISKILKRVKPEKICRAIVDTALSTDSFVRPGLRNDSNYYEIINGGKDNTTAVLYNGRRK